MSSRSKQNRNTPGRPKPADLQPGNVTEDQQRRFLAMMHSEYHGPLPPPQMIEEYERVHPGMAERLISRFEQQAEHRQSLERQVVTAQIASEQAAQKDAGRGQVFGFAVAVLGLVAAVAIALLGQTPTHAWAASIIGGGTLVGLVTAFVVGRVTEPPADGMDDKEQES